MANVTQGTRGTASYPASQRPGHFGGKIKLQGSRVSRKDVERRLKKRKRRKP